MTSMPYAISHDRHLSSILSVRTERFSCSSRFSQKNTQTTQKNHNVGRDTGIRALLRRHGGHLSHRVQRIWCGLRHGQEWDGYRGHERDAAGAHHEVHHSRGHGGYHRHLRSGGRCAHRQQHGQLRPVHNIQELPPLGCGVECGLERPRCWIRRGDRRRRGRARDCPTASAICRYDPDPDLCGGAGSVRADRRPYPLHQEVVNATLVSPGSSQPLLKHRPDLGMTMGAPTASLS